MGPWYARTEEDGDRSWAGMWAGVREVDYRRETLDKVLGGVHG